MKSKSLAGGYVNIYRSLLEHPQFGDPDWVSVWLFLLLSANYKPQKVFFKNQHIELGPGHVITNRRTIARVCGVQEDKVARILKRMIDDGQIAYHKEDDRGSKDSMFTVVNWSVHQPVTKKVRIICGSLADHR